MIRPLMITASVMSLIGLAPAWPQTVQDSLAADMRAALDAPDRDAVARMRDQDRETPELLALARILPGATVLDVGSGGGYMAMIMSSLTGPDGRVDMHNSPNWIDQLPGIDPQNLKRRIRRSNIRFITTEFDAINSPDAEYDVIVMAQVYHDTPIGYINRRKMNENFFRMLKPGGRLVISDHHAIDGHGVSDAVKFHRIERSVVVDEVLQAGFVLEDLREIEMADRRNVSVFNPAVRGKTDKFIIAFTKVNAPS